ncbi:mitochondrial inner membrane protease subunit 1-like isoform X1 [Cucurbita moschata]|uniref:Mitochondrial inner membrane protease subunit 1-like isoform X1 n=1 Tax=Cucurbita moschata TaxID=3662 RepID=A0A6J1EKW2_CUCMO|nr:mitochondrial inner membrane protease subunit 1-like isoform X1 [Cucurbita moschata]
MAKRLMGMEGDSVTYVVDPKNNDWCETVVVPKGHVWIEGDNMYDSKDSRYFGAVPYGLLQGKVFWRLWPPKSLGPLEKRKSNETVLGGKLNCSPTSDSLSFKNYLFIYLFS